MGWKTRNGRPICTRDGALVGGDDCKCRRCCDVGERLCPTKEPAELDGLVLPDSVAFTISGTSADEAARLLINCSVDSSSLPNFQEWLAKQLSIDGTYVIEPPDDLTEEQIRSYGRLYWQKDFDLGTIARVEFQSITPSEKFCARKLRFKVYFGGDVNGATPPHVIGQRGPFLKGIILTIELIELFVGECTPVLFSKTLKCKDVNPGGDEDWQKEWSESVYWFGDSRFNNTFDEPPTAPDPDNDGTKVTDGGSVTVQFFCGGGGSNSAPAPSAINVDKDCVEDPTSTEEPTTSNPATTTAPPTTAPTSNPPSTTTPPTDGDTSDPDPTTDPCNLHLTPFSSYLLRECGESPDGIAHGPMRPDLRVPPSDGSRANAGKTVRIGDACYAVTFCRSAESPNVTTWDEEFASCLPCLQATRYYNLRDCESLTPTNVYVLVSGYLATIDDGVPRKVCHIDDTCIEVVTGADYSYDDLPEGAVIIESVDLQFETCEDCQTSNPNIAAICWEPGQNPVSNDPNTGDDSGCAYKSITPELAIATNAGGLSLAVYRCLAGDWVYAGTGNYNASDIVVDYHVPSTPDPDRCPTP